MNVIDWLSNLLVSKWLLAIKMMLVEKMNDSVLVAPTVGILTALKQRNFGNMKPSRTETRERGNWKEKHFSRANDREI